MNLDGKMEATWVPAEVLTSTRTSVTVLVPEHPWGTLVLNNLTSLKVLTIGKPKPLQAQSNIKGFFTQTGSGSSADTGGGSNVAGARAIAAKESDRKKKHAKLMQDKRRRVPGTKDVFKVEHILQVRQQAGKMKEYLVRWLGYDASSDSWVPASQVGTQAVDSFFDWKGLPDFVALYAALAKRKEQLGRGLEYEAYVKPSLHPGDPQFGTLKRMLAMSKQVCAMHGHRNAPESTHERRRKSRLHKRTLPTGAEPAPKKARANGTAGMNGSGGASVDGKQAEAAADVDMNGSGGANVAGKQAEEDAAVNDDFILESSSMQSLTTKAKDPVKTHTWESIAANRQSEINKLIIGVKGGVEHKKLQQLYENIVPRNRRSRVPINFFGKAGLKPLDDVDCHKVVSIVDVTPEVREIQSKDSKKANTHQITNQEWLCLCGSRGTCIGSSSKVTEHLASNKHLDFMVKRCAAKDSSQLCSQRYTPSATGAAPHETVRHAAVVHGAQTSQSFASAARALKLAQLVAAETKGPTTDYDLNRTTHFLNNLPTSDSLKFAQEELKRSIKEKRSEVDSLDPSEDTRKKELTSQIKALNGAANCLGGASTLNSSNAARDVAATLKRVVEGTKTNAAGFGPYEMNRITVQRHTVQQAADLIEAITDLLGPLNFVGAFLDESASASKTDPCYVCLQICTEDFRWFSVLVGQTDTSVTSSAEELCDAVKSVFQGKLEAVLGLIKVLGTDGCAAMRYVPRLFLSSVDRLQFVRHIYPVVMCCPSSVVQYQSNDSPQPTNTITTEDQPQNTPGLMHGMLASQSHSQQNSKKCWGVS
jgi:hypothetical protein